MGRGLRNWCLAISVAAVTYAELDRRYHGWTLSENLRPWAREHPALFTGACVAAPLWFHKHILK